MPKKDDPRKLGEMIKDAPFRHLAKRHNIRRMRSDVFIWLKNFTIKLTKTFIGYSINAMKDYGENNTTLTLRDFNTYSLEPYVNANEAPVSPVRCKISSPKKDNFPILNRRGCVYIPISVFKTMLDRIMNTYFKGYTIEKAAQDKIHWFIERYLWSLLRGCAMLLDYSGLKTLSIKELEVAERHLDAYRYMTISTRDS